MRCISRGMSQYLTLSTSTSRTILILIRSFLAMWLRLIILIATRSFDGVPAAMLDEAMLSPIVWALDR